MNIHVPEEIKIKYPQYEFRGKKREINDRIVKIIQKITHPLDFFLVEHSGHLPPSSIHIGHFV